MCSPGWPAFCLSRTHFFSSFFYDYLIHFSHRMSSNVWLPFFPTYSSRHNGGLISAWIVCLCIDFKQSFLFTCRLHILYFFFSSPTFGFLFSLCNGTNCKKNIYMCVLWEKNIRYTKQMGKNGQDAFTEFLLLVACVWEAIKRTMNRTRSSGFFNFYPAGCNTIMQEDWTSGVGAAFIFIYEENL